jgi:hypothetical protein
MKEMPEFNQARIFAASDTEYIKKQISTVLLFKHDIAEVILRLLPPNISHSFLLICPTVKKELSDLFLFVRPTKKKTGQFKNKKNRGK